MIVLPVDMVKVDLQINWSTTTLWGNKYGVELDVRVEPGLVVLEEPELKPELQHVQDFSEQRVTERSKSW